MDVVDSESSSPVLQIEPLTVRPLYLHRNLDIMKVQAAILLAVLGLVIGSPVKLVRYLYSPLIAFAGTDSWKG